MRPEISVVILCYGVGERMYKFTEKVISVLEGAVPSWEIILVGNYVDNPGDETARVVKDIASKRENIKACTLQKEGMMGWDARSGLERAGGRHICLIDGDEQMLPEDIARVYRKITNDDLDFVQTYRAVRHDSSTRKIISFIYNTLFRLLFPGIGVRDVNSKPKILRKESYDKMRLTADDWFLDAEMIIQARRLKLKIDEIPMEFYKCRYRKSFVDVNAVFEFVKNIFYARIKEFLNKCKTKISL